MQGNDVVLMFYLDFLTQFRPNGDCVLLVQFHISQLLKKIPNDN